MQSQISEFAVKRISVLTCVWCTASCMVSVSAVN